MHTAFLNLDKWSLQDGGFRRETLDQIAAICRLVSHYVDDHLPAARSAERSVVLAAAEQRVFTQILHLFLGGIPNHVSARAVWMRARSEAPRTKPVGSCPPIFVDKQVGREFFDLFQFTLSRHEKRDNGTPWVTSFGYLIEGLSREQLHQVVERSLQNVPELQEVVECAPSSSSSLSSS